MKIVLALLVALPAFGQCRYGRNGKYQLPDTKCTPGALRPVTVQQLCPHADTKAVRDVTEAEKKAVCKEYGISPTLCNGKIGEQDHLVSLELGGSNVIKNIWFQKYPAAHIKDKLEDRLHSEVCHGKMTLKAAQQCISKDWVSCATNQEILEDK